MQAALEIARTVFPAMDDDALGYAIWNETGFPGFWRIPEDGATPEECLGNQLSALKDRVIAGDDDE